MRVDAPVAESIRIGGGEAVINSRVGGSVTFEGDKLTLGPNASIGGNLIYKSPKEAVIADGAVVKGETSYESRAAVKGFSREGLGKFVFGVLVIKFLSVLIFALLVGLLLPKYSHKLVENSVSKPFSEIGRGFVALVIIPILSCLLFVTVVGIPFGILGVISLVALMIGSSFMMPVVLGSILHRWAFKKTSHEVTWKTILLGTVVITLLTLIPIVGWLIVVLLMLLTLGSIVHLKLDMLKEWR